MTGSNKGVGWAAGLFLLAFLVPDFTRQNNLAKKW